MIDEIDRQILNNLQENGRISFSDIAKKLEKPVSTIFERIKKLENEGIIKKYTAIIDHEKVDKGFEAYMLGQAQLGKDADFDKIGKILSEIPGVQEVHFTTGDWDFIIKIRVKDQKEYYEISKIIAKSCISRGKGMFVPKTFKEDYSIKL